MNFTAIEWTIHSFNPWIGCTKVSPACKFCYAERDMDHRYGKVSWGPSGNRVVTSDKNWNKPGQWHRSIGNGKCSVCKGKKTRAGGIRCETCNATGIPMTRPTVFCASLADVFEKWGGPMLDHKGNELYIEKTYDDPKWTTIRNVGPSPPRSHVSMNDARKRLFKVIDATPNLIWLLLTKRPENVFDMWPCKNDTDGDGNCSECGSGRNAKPACKFRENVILGTSIESQEWADKRLPFLHAAKKLRLVDTTFVSAEPLVGPIDMKGHLGPNGIDWVITGGESGPEARTMEPDWFRGLRDQCVDAGKAFHFKQWGEWIPYERSTDPMLESQHGHFVDGHELPDGLVEHEPVDKWYWPDGLSDTIHRRVGKKNAGRKLDGVIHHGFPDKITQKIEVPASAFN